jgi:hypothetical protein
MRTASPAAAASARTLSATFAGSSYLGRQGITWNQSKRISVRALGYPSQAPFHGRWLYYCDGTTFPEWEFLCWSAETLGLSCDTTKGASGGGWIAYLNSWGGGYLDRVDVRETGEAVTVTLWVGRRPDADCDGPQRAIGFPIVVPIDLKEPLGRRPVRDGAR